MTITILMLLLTALNATAQLPYNWTSGTNPGWTSSNPTNNTLSWQSSIMTVSTSGLNTGTGNWYRYNNNQNTTYTSPQLNFTSCNTSAYVTVMPSLDINLENGWDFLYLQYSSDNGATWIPLGTYTGPMGPITPSYTIPKTTNRFRFVFTSDATVNSYGNGANTFIYYADILGFSVTRPIFLPVELISFKGFKEAKENRLVWEIESETNCAYYTIERSTDGINWNLIQTINATGSNLYYIMDVERRNVINYYRLSQVDNNGEMTVYDEEIVSIDNRTSGLQVISVTNLLGQKITEPYSGVVIFTYEDGSTVKKYIQK